MHVGDALEGSLLRSEEPIDGAVLIHLLMVFPEVLHEVLLHGLAEALLHIVEVLHMFCVPQSNAYEVGKAVGGIVGEAAVARHQGDDAILVYLKLHLIIYIRRRFLGCWVRVSDVQSLLVEAVAPHHATYGIADELLHHHVVVPYDMLFFLFHVRLKNKIVFILSQVLHSPFSRTLSCVL